MLNVSEEILLSVFLLLCSVLWSLWLKPFWFAWFYVSLQFVLTLDLIFFHIVTFVSVFLYLSCNLFQFPFNQSCACIWCDCVMWLAWCWWCHPHWWAEGKHTGPASSSHVQDYPSLISGSLHSSLTSHYNSLLSHF